MRLKFPPIIWVQAVNWLIGWCGYRVELGWLRETSLTCRVSPGYSPGAGGCSEPSLMEINNRIAVVSFVLSLWNDRLFDKPNRFYMRSLCCQHSQWNALVRKSRDCLKTVPMWTRKITLRYLPFVRKFSIKNTMWDVKTGPDERLLWEHQSRLPCTCQAAAW